MHKRFFSVYGAPMVTFAKFLALGAALYMLAAAWLYFSQKRMLFFPRAEHVAAPGLIGMKYSDVYLTNRLGTRIHGWWVPRDGARYAVLFAHGNGGNVSHRLETIRIFHELGLSVMLYDYSGYGKSEGEPSEEGMYADARAAWGWLTREQEIAPERVVLFGRSLGGAVTAHLAAELAGEGMRPAGMVLESTFTSVPDMAAYTYPWMPVRPLVRYQYDSAEALESVNVPTLFAHSEDDEIVPYALGLRLYEGYAGPKSFLSLTGDHNSGYLTMGDAYIQGLATFLTGLGSD